MHTDREIIGKLYDYGHLGGPHLAGIQELRNAANVTHKDLDRLTLKDPEVRAALASFQGFMVEPYERLTAEHRGTAARVVGDFGDGEFDEATRRLFEVPRCGMPDLVEGGFGASGSWQLPCRTEGVTFYVDKAGMPTTYANVWDSEILPAVIDAYRRVGARMKQVFTRGGENIFNSFPPLFGSTIGLASLHAGNCSSRGFCRLDRDFRCTKEEAKELLAHEWGHNWNHGHRRRGIMSASIGQVIEFKGWEGDDAYPVWVQFTDGKPLPPLGGPIPPEEFFTGVR